MNLILVVFPLDAEMCHGRQPTLLQVVWNYTLCWDRKQPLLKCYVIEINKKRMDIWVLKHLWEFIKMAFNPRIVMHLYLAMVFSQIVSLLKQNNGQIYMCFSRIFKIFMLKSFFNFDKRVFNFSWPFNRVFPYVLLPFNIFAWNVCTCFPLSKNQNKSFIWFSTRLFEP